MNDYEAYRTWNMGHGMLLICPSFEEVTAAATEHGIESRVVGQITDTSSITINSKGIEGASLVY
jgi:phosphoribosylaminoimidazole (AIR) synthetase